MKEPTGLTGTDACVVVTAAYTDLRSDVVNRRGLPLGCSTMSSRVHSSGAVAVAAAPVMRGGRTIGRFGHIWMRR